MIAVGALSIAATTVVAACGALSTSAAAPLSPSAVQTFSLSSKQFGNTRTIRVWLPPGYGDAANEHTLYPVLYLNDGFAVLSPKSWNAPEALDRSVGTGELRPLIVVGIDNGATASDGSVAQRTREYVPYRDAASDPDTSEAMGDRYPAFLVDEVMPAVAARFRVRNDRAGVGVGGSSYGGVAALYAVLRRPDRFGRLMLESTPTFLANGSILTEASAARRWPERISIAVGTAESEDPALNASIVPAARRLEQIIHKASPSSQVRLFIEDGAAHNSKAWGRRLPLALKFLWGQSKD